MVTSAAKLSVGWSDRGTSCARAIRGRDVSTSFRLGFGLTTRSASATFPGIHGVEHQADDEGDDERHQRETS